MARRISVEILGDASSLDRAFKKASHSARGFHHDIGKATRGALSGSGLVHHAGRSLAFASGGFLASASITEALTTSVEAATEAAATQRQLQTQLKASGISFKQYRDQIDQTNLRESALSGFTKDELDKSFTTIVRGSGNVNKALAYTALAADIARGRHISLTTAAVAVGKAAAGSTTSLKRLGLQFEKGTTSVQALAIATQKFHGQARAGATVQQKFAAVLHDSEVIIGTALLPTLSRLLTKGTHWLAQMNRTGRLQRDVAHAAKFMTQVLHGVEAIVVPVAHGFRAFQHAVGGTRHAVEILGVAFGAWKVAGVLAKVAELTTAFGGLAAAEGAAGSGGVPGAGKGGAGKGVLKGLGKTALRGGPLAGAALLGFAYSKGFTTPLPKKIGKTSTGSDLVTTSGQVYVQAAGRLTRPSPQTMAKYNAQHGGVHIHGPVHVHGVQNIDQLASKLDKAAKKHPRRGGR